MAALTIHNDFGSLKRKIRHWFHFFLLYLHKVRGPYAMISVFWMLSFKPAFFLSPLSPSSWGSLVPLHVLPLEWCHLHIKVIDISPGYLDSSLWSSSPEFGIKYSAYKLNKQGDNISTCYTPFPISNQSVVPFWF